MSRNVRSSVISSLVGMPEDGGGWGGGARESAQPRAPRTGSDFGRREPIRSQFAHPARSGRRGGCTALAGGGMWPQHHLRRRSCGCRRRIGHCMDGWGCRQVKEMAQGSVEERATAELARRCARRTLSLYEADAGIAAMCCQGWPQARVGWWWRYPLFPSQVSRGCRCPTPLAAPRVAPAAAGSARGTLACPPFRFALCLFGLGGVGAMLAVNAPSVENSVHIESDVLCTMGAATSACRGMMLPGGPGGPAGALHRCLAVVGDRLRHPGG